MSFPEFCSFVLYSPPGSAVFHRLNHGWTSDTHKITDLIELTKMLVCANAENPREAFDKVERDWRPGDHIPDPKSQPKQMTIAEYIERAGLTMTEEVAVAVDS